MLAVMILGARVIQSLVQRRELEQLWQAQEKPEGRAFGGRTHSEKIKQFNNRLKRGPGAEAS
jgi:hypothetical protein